MAQNNPCAKNEKSKSLIGLSYKSAICLATSFAKTINAFLISRSILDPFIITKSWNCIGKMHNSLRSSCTVFSFSFPYLWRRTSSPDSLRSFQSSTASITIGIAFLTKERLFKTFIRKLASLSEISTNIFIVLNFTHYSHFAEITHSLKIRRVFSCAFATLS